MKKIFLIPLIAFLYSCGGQEEGENNLVSNYELVYEMDTVLVDPGDHFFFLNWGMTISDISSDAKTLYNLNPNSFLLEIVDLDQMKLKETVQLEREGPNGVGAGGFIASIQVLDNGNLKLFDFNTIYEINLKGELVDTFKFDKSEWSGFEIPEGQKIAIYGTFSPDGKMFFTRLVEEGFGEPAKSFLKLDLEAKTISQLDVGDLFERIGKFDITMDTDQMRMVTGEQVFSGFVNDDFVISTSTFNEAFILKFGSDSLERKVFKAGLTSNSKTAEASSVFDSREAFIEARKRKNEQVVFEGMIAQPDENLLWRITLDKDRVIADSVIKKQVITLFDQDYNMLHEQKIEDYPTSAIRFFKDGMLHTFVNIDDEMAFARLKPIEGSRTMLKED